MQISSTGLLGTNFTTPLSSSPLSERAERKENDGDRDDAKTSAIPLKGAGVNLQGQLTGQLVRAQA